MTSNSQSTDDMKAALGIAVDDPADGDVADGEPAADAVAEPPSAPQSTTSQPATPQEAKPLKQDKKRERYEEMDRQRHEAIRERDRIKQESEQTIERLRAEWRKEFEEHKRAQPKAEPPQTQPQVGDDPEPDYTDASKYPDAQFDRKYLKDQARWEARQEFKTLRQQEAERAQAEHRERQQYERQQQERQRIAGFAQKVEGVLKDQPELRARIEHVALSRPMWDVVIESEHPHQLLAYMADHPEEAQEMSSLAPLQAYRRLSRIDYSLETAATLTGSAPAKPKTSAHPPVSPVSGSHAAPSSSGPPGPDATYEEHKAYWDEQERAEAKGRR